MYRSLLSRWKQLSDVAQILQPHGCYSVQRLRKLKIYTESSNRFRVLLACILTPIPCVALATLVESVPLASPEAGPYNNYIFWIRAWIVTGFVDYSMVIQMSQSLAQLKMQHSYIVTIALAGSIVSFLTVFAVAVWVVFPVPFSMLVASPPSVVVILVGFGCMWGHRWWSDTGLRRDLARHTQIFMCQVALTFIYPLYIFGFTSLSGMKQLLYVLVLPLIKSVSKNWISYNLSHHSDIKPEVVIFNIEVFNALYVSAAVQKSTSLGTTITLMLIDVLHFWFSMKGTLDVLKKVKNLMAKIPPHHPVAQENFVEVALRLLAIEGRAESSDQLRHRISIKKESTDVLKTTLYSTRMNAHFFGALKRTDIIHGRGISHLLMPQIRKIFPITQQSVLVVGSISPGPAAELKAQNRSSQRIEAIFSRQERVEFIGITSRVLYITEYLVLVEFTEAVLPMVYGTNTRIHFFVILLTILHNYLLVPLFLALYSVIAFHLPNARYNHSFVNVSRQDLLANVSSVLAYSTLEMLSLVLAMMVLKRKLKCSPVHQLGFVLETQAAMIQSKLMLWFVYVMQVPLEHVGRAWLSLALPGYWNICPTFTISMQVLISPLSSSGHMLPVQW
ncbi:unnamed protein product [Phytophthora fragariaefolia]|uniref:Unnamed protein product n=1 Tax=Phytophthora fragariaefolia TaxID=1490495 RepID=A0A9W6Y7R0_9STRA|nr:unnamed protein product [Phytophthora fragariaefolia]